MLEFREVHPTKETNWRSVILFGQNVASYKFAPGKSLLELAAQGQEFASEPCPTLAYCNDHGQEFAAA